MDLSAPKDHSVNNDMADNLCSLKYPLINTAIELVLSLGQGACVSKLDIKEAYQMVPVQPEDPPEDALARGLLCEHLPSVRPPICP